MSLSQRELFAISTTERICSAISLAGTSIIIISFLASSSFRKPINRLVFYASWGNIMANVATMISQSGIAYGTRGCLCQFQAFLIQWFMPADALWTLAMACNVYLTFFYKYNSEQLRQLEWKYVLFCYGLPFLPAFVYFFIETEARGKVYGSAILWCWVSLPWDFLRIAVFYGPVWFVISLTFAIYLRAGKVIFEKRRQLEEAGCSDSCGEIDSPMEPAFSKKTEIHVTSEITHSGSESNRLTITSASHIPHRYLNPYSPYSVTIEGGSASGNDENVPMRTLRSSQHDPYAQRRATARDVNSAAWAYTKYAMLFFIALLVTWVPSTINRLYALICPDNFNFGLNYTSSFVLPLQGFWNSIIYISISWPAFKEAFAKIKLRHSVKRGPSQHISTGHGAVRSLHSHGNDSTRALTG
ncbi:G-protein coupled receptor 1 [Aspergillus udagawae]|uniref:G-protein coupled receptor 1 n=1 Tax=Aspergillus udagawae TaxID=91492 RepID=A0ABQ1AWY5_9EURO|nr:G-protein coupled receptor 1 [Aspergillus udagawae]GFF89591.1 G-protein coupled receptor 1 [Aspergillus udagawae]GFG06412.1 G-protein coupled receptor 1 [Aspergillus udagawae]